MDVDDVFAEAIAPRYRIERTLGEGGMAIVYLARDSRHNRFVALKVLRPEVATALGAERFLREITIAARLVHPNIIPLHDSGEVAGRLYYVMPYVEGATLRQRLDREKQLPLADVADITTQIAAALDHAHGQGVVHRDVKPDNVLLVNDRVLVADFGLARALTSASSSPLTRSGTVVGTPAYMSPEQCAPGEVVDTRSDVYALACMTFEMIAGVTPFRGATAQAMMAHQISGDPPSVCAERERCPAAVDEVLKRGLAKSPADRYQRAGEFATALREAVSSGSTSPVARGPVKSMSRQRARRWMPAGALAIAIVVGGWFVARSAGAGPALDRNLYVVFPLRMDSAATTNDLDGEDVAHMLFQAMSNWSGIRLVNDMIVNDLWSRQRPQTVEEALDAAQRLAAGELAWGELTTIGDSLEIHVVSYDVARGADATRDFTMHVARKDRGSRQLDSVIVALADSIIVGGRGPDRISVYGTRNVLASDEFRHGSGALERFDLRAAQEHFDAATQADEHFALAYLWAARVRAWRGVASPSAWQAPAKQAVRLSDSLSTTDSLHALALLDLAEGNAPRACARYRRLTQSDSMDFAAWLGLGDCNARDDAVVPDTRSRTGHAFRGSFNAAVKAYTNALMLVRSYPQAERGSVFQRLTERVLYSEESRLRRGIGVWPDTERYVAFPSFVGESLAFFPVSYERFRREDIRPPTEQIAVAWAARTKLALTRQWMDAFRNSPDAQAAYASALETAAAIDGSAAGLPEALRLARLAAQRTDSADLRLYRAVAVVRLLLKADSLGAARRLADSLLAVTRNPTPYQAGFLANLAALTGSATRAASLLRLAATDSTHVPFLDATGRPLVLPGELMPSILALRVYAALGAPRDSILGTYRRVGRMLQRTQPAQSLQAMRRLVLATPAIVATEDLGARELVRARGTDALLDMRAAVARHDSTGAREAGVRFEALADRYLPGSVGIDRSTAYATMLVAIGDSMAAARVLDDAIDAVPRARSILLEVAPQAAAIGRAFLLRTQLAIGVGDTATARRCFREVDALWSGGDSEVKLALSAVRRRL